MVQSFPRSVIDKAWERARGKCECQRISCGHNGRCNKRLWKASRGKESPMGWKAHHIRRTSPAAPSNCEILCQYCHKHTRSYGQK